MIIGEFEASLMPRKAFAKNDPYAQIAGCSRTF